MDLQNIKHLILKYEKGDTTLVEEQELRQWFLQSKNVPKSLEHYAMLFGFYAKEQSVVAPRKTINKKPLQYRWWMAVAASALLLALAVWYGNSTTKNDLGTYEDPHVAFNKTKDILNTVSIYLNEGAGELAYLKELNKTKNKLVHDNQ